jgi:hypothetical protein|nr:MAG TPA: hypothetical protein [Caudoviricetes sp.]
MSLYTELEKNKSLWHPITDEDFDIDFSKPVVLCEADCSLSLVDGIEDMYDHADDWDFYDKEAQNLTEKGKDWFRDMYFGYMYIDDEFYEAIKPFSKNDSIDQVKGVTERPDLFVKYKDGEFRLFCSYDFDMDGSYEKSWLTSFIGYTGSPIEYVVNLRCCPRTTMHVLFAQPVVPLRTAYVVTSGEYSGYHIDGVFSDEEKANLFADKKSDRGVEEYDIDDEQMLRQEDWYEVKIYVGESLEPKDCRVLNLSYTAGNKPFDAVMFSKTGDDNRYFSFYLAAINRGKAKAIALERFHALLAVEPSHFPMLRWVRIVDPFRNYKILESLVFGYFDYKAYFCPLGRIERTQDLFMKIKDFLPIPLTEEDEDSLDWQNLTEETCLQLMRSHGLDIELKKDLSYVFGD